MGVEKKIRLHLGVLSIEQVNALSFVHQDNVLKPTDGTVIASKSLTIPNDLAESMLEDLNKAIKPIKDKYAGIILTRMENTLKEYLTEQRQQVEQ